MPSRQPDIDTLLAGWPYAPGEVAARRSHGSDGRPVLQLRVDLGVLQMEVSGRPDGSRPDGHATMLQALQAAVRAGEVAFDEETCIEVDREFLQFYHRRVAWMALRRFNEAVADADHTLALMDFTAAYAFDEDWVDLHEHYRPFVLYHRTQAAALSALEAAEPKEAVRAIEDGIAAIQAVFDRPECEIDPEEIDEFADNLEELRASIEVEYELPENSTGEGDRALADRLADAIAAEQYELAAELRDRIASRRAGRR